jgi:hypothetical protein
MIGQNYFGPRKKKEDATIPNFGTICHKDSMFGIIFWSNSELVYFESTSLEIIWSKVVTVSSPSLWIVEDLAYLTNSLLLYIAKDTWFTELVSVPKGTTEKVRVVSAGETKVSQLVIQEEKEKTRNGKKSAITFRDISNYYEEGLIGLSKDFGCNYPTDDLQDICIATLSGTKSIYSFFLDNFGIALKITLGATILYALQSNYIESKVPKLSKKQEEFILPAFYGGKTEVYRIHSPLANGYDKNGLYAEAYCKTLPLKGFSYYKLTIEEFLEETKLGFAKVDIYVPESLGRGPLPYRKNDKIYYPTGLIERQTYFTEEIKNAVEKYGCILQKIHRLAYFNTSDSILKEWAIYTGKLKEESITAGERQLARMCQNIPYGKFAQKEEALVMHLGLIPSDRRDDPRITILSDDLPIWFEKVKRYLGYRLPHIAAAITANARIIMDSDIRQLELDGTRKVIYTDSDSLYMTGLPLPEDMLGKELGKYKVVFENSEVYSPSSKLYIVTNPETGEVLATASLGFPKGTLTIESIEELKSGKSLAAVWEQPISIPEVLVKKLKYSSSPEDFSEIDKLTKEASRSYPGKDRLGTSILDLDTKRKQLSLEESRPWTIKELKIMN